MDEERADHVRWIFDRFIEIGSCTELARELAARGIQTSPGNRIDKKYLHRLLNNRAYIDAVIDRDIWGKVHAILQESPRKTLLKSGVLRAVAGTLVLASDYSFKSASAAAATVIGASANGRILGKLADGRCYADWEAEGTRLKVNPKRMDETGLDDGPFRMRVELENGCRAISALEKRNQSVNPLNHSGLVDGSRE